MSIPRSPGSRPASPPATDQKAPTTSTAPAQSKDPAQGVSEPQNAAAPPPPAAATPPEPATKPTAETSRKAVAQHQANMGAQHLQAKLNPGSATTYATPAPSTDDALAGKAVIKRGQSGESVKQLQQDLNAAGANPPLDVDGKFGAKTDVAVRGYQKSHGLKVDGQVGPETSNAVHGPSGTSIQNDPKFQSLNDATKAQVKDRLNKAADPQARKNIAELALSDGFAKLSPAHQNDALTAQAAAPADKQLTADLKAATGSDKFRNLNDATKSQVLQAHGKNAASPDARKNLQDLAESPGFAKLNPAHQKQALDTLGKAPADAQLATDVKGLVASDKFRNLNDTVKSTALQEMGRHPTDAAARKTVSDLAQSPGFGGMADADKNKLLKYVGGTNRDVSTPGRTAMRKLLDDPAYGSATPAQQTAKLNKFLTDQPGAPGVVSPAAGAFDAKRAAYTVKGPQEVKNYAFKSGAADANKYTVTVDGRDIPVYMPKTPGPGDHSIEQVAKGLAALPKSSRALVKNVNVDPKANPDDAYWKKEYKDPNFSSYMTAGKAGVITIYPSNPKQSQDYLDGTMIHETGHTLSKQKWGENSDKRWDDWKNAAASDKVVPSKYAKASVSEDFAETLQVYQQVKGTPQEAEMRALMPGRFRIIDELLSGKR